MSEKQYVVFSLAGEIYGINILDIQEITRYEKTTRIPNMSAFMDGIINLRGRVIPVVNLRKSFNLENGEITDESRIIVVSLYDKKAGFLVDEVSRVTKIAEDAIEVPQEISGNFHREIITGIAKKDGEVITLLEPAALLAAGKKENAGKGAV